MNTAKLEVTPKPIPMPTVEAARISQAGVRVWVS
jgi:hypothetical protein